MRLHRAESWFSPRFVRHHGTSCRAVAYIYRVGHAWERSGARGVGEVQPGWNRAPPGVRHLLLGLIRITL
jgi:hypothetical protein